MYTGVSVPGHPSGHRLGGKSELRIHISMLSVLMSCRIGLAGARATFLKACIVKELSNHLGLPQLGVHCEEIKDEIARGVGGCFNTADAYHEAGNLLHGCSTTFLLDIFDPEMVGTRTISWQEVYRLGKKWGYFSIAGGRLTPTRAVELVWHLPVSRVSIDSGGSE